MTAPTFEEIRQFDLKSICYHEAGHLVALTALGGLGRILIEEADDGGEELKLFKGRCQFLMPPTAERGRVLVGLAGAVAEELLHNMQVDAFEIYDWLDGGAIAMSDSDAEIAAGYTPEDIEQTTALLRDNWPEVQRLAEWEIRVWGAAA